MKTQQAATDVFPEHRRETWEPGRTRSFDPKRPLSSGNRERERLPRIRRGEIDFRGEKRAPNYSSYDLWEQVNRRRLRRHGD